MFVSIYTRIVFIFTVILLYLNVMSVVISICYTFTCSFHCHCVFSSSHLMFAESRFYIWDVKLLFSVWNNHFISSVWNYISKLLFFSCAQFQQVRVANLDIEAQWETSRPSLTHLFSGQNRYFLSLPLSVSVSNLWTL